MTDTAAAPGRRHRDLQPLATGNDLPERQGLRASRTTAPSTGSTTPLPSPSLVAARAYYREHVVPIGHKYDALQRRRSLIEGQQIPRRHSTLSTPGDTRALAIQLANLQFSCEDQNLQPVPETANQGSNIKEEGIDDIILNEVIRNDIAEAGTCTAPLPSNGLRDPAVNILRKVPFQYTHDHLREWGYAYLGNTATADAFVNAVSLRRPSLALVKEDDVQVKCESLGMVTIRARVLPKAKERHPFLIQRQFDIEELRTSIPAPQKPRRTSEDSGSTQVKRSYKLRRSSTQEPLVRNQRRGIADRNRGAQLESLGKRELPIREFS